MPNNISGINPTGTPSALDVANAGNEAISFREQLPDLEQKLREALTTKFQNNPLFAQREQQQTDFLAAPDRIRADISGMQQSSGVPLSPTQQQAITSERRAAAYAPLSTTNLMLGSAFGGLNDIVSSGTKAFEAAAGAKDKRAELMNTMRQQEIERQFKEQQMSINLAKLSLQQSGGNLSSTERLKGKTALAGLNQVNSFKKKYAQFTNTGPLQGFMTNLLKNFLPKSKLVDPYLANMQSDIGPLRDQVLNAISGANVSAKEAERINSWIPSNTKSPEENARNLSSLEAWLNDNYSAITGDQYGGSDWEIVQ